MYEKLQEVIVYSSKMTLQFACIAFQSMAFTAATASTAKESVSSRKSTIHALALAGIEDRERADNVKSFTVQDSFTAVPGIRDTCRKHRLASNSVIVYPTCPTTELRKKHSHKHGK